MHEINTLLHSILDTIFEPKRQPWQILQDDNQFDLLRKLLKNRKWGILQKDKVDKWEKPKKKLYIAKKAPSKTPT
jgi:hypothetical protein